tara:strand:+ start:1472 stop:1843 length:372 start_codon:yes stop_codon:yes gene_type:complete
MNWKLNTDHRGLNLAMIRGILRIKLLRTFESNHPGDCSDEWMEWAAMGIDIVGGEEALRIETWLNQLTPLYEKWKVNGREGLFPIIPTSQAFFPAARMADPDMGDLIGKQRSELISKAGWGKK